MSTRPVVWILEDDAGARFVYGEILEFRAELKFFVTLGELKSALDASLPLPSLLIADMRLPDGAFIDLLVQTKHAGLFNVAFIVVSSVDDIDILRECFAEGALDYITKPFNKMELLAKVERILARTRSNSITINGSTLVATLPSGEKVQLTPKELQILSILGETPGARVERRQIVNLVWGDVSVSKKTLDVHLVNLRRKLATSGTDIEFVAPDSFRLQQKG